MILPYIYLGLVLLGLCFVFFRSETSLLRGDRFLKFNLIFWVISILLFFVRKTSLEYLTTISLAIVVVISFLFRNKWLLFKYSPLKTWVVVEDSLSRVLIPFQKAEGNYILKQVVDVNTYLKFISFWPNCAIIIFGGGWHLKKVEVLKNLLKKSFSGVFPRLVIKIK